MKTKQQLIQELAELDSSHVRETEVFYNTAFFRGVKAMSDAIKKHIERGGEVNDALLDGIVYEMEHKVATYSPMGKTENA
jgi:hypothetical protein